MRDLIKRSLYVYPGIRFCWGEDRYECTYDISEVAEQFDGCYSIHNAVIAFCVDRKMYVIPYEIAVLESLRRYGFPEREFFVPFSHKDYPKGKKAEWQLARVRAMQLFHP
ncbi:hypothetical protein IKG64_03365 [Candidatus Saccharibacteria bacterium]|nr:hypothetical protein [Candidatus Saccharibacteria bacterium]